MKWSCEVCGYVHDGEKPPTLCPKCGAGVDAFFRVYEGTSEVPEDEVEKLLRDQGV